MIVKILKIIAIIAFLLTQGIGQHSTLNIGIIFMAVYQFISDILNPEYGILWEGLGMIFLIGTFIVFLSCQKYKDRYLLTFCFIGLFIALIFLTEVYDPSNYKRIESWFIIPSLLFIVSSILSIILVFRNEIE
ncbi:hypothetical protein BBI01_03355 [Chryseobacterium artocarpi]|uniref:DoxX family protein n=1 Tax=Chryseobacterium artocarpi TaxID=1414727 RepID=A0A1B9A0V2_9FLAO|nr:hypothetical protein [Chryseobacterium artocarpi]OCA77496.1 hypothetical protein BBI01_03355 [Chryseobacterium artocarpi]